MKLGHEIGAFKLLTGMLITSFAFAALPMLTYLFPNNSFAVAFIGIACLANFGVVIFLSLSAPSDVWRVFQLTLCLAFLYFVHIVGMPSLVSP